MDHIGNEKDTEFLKPLFKGDKDESIEAMWHRRRNVKWELNYEQDLLIAFWLAIHNENLYLAQMWLDFDLSLRYIVALAMKGKKEFRPKPSKSKDGTTTIYESAQSPGSPEPMSVQEGDDGEERLPAFANLQSAGDPSILMGRGIYTGEEAPINEGGEGEES